MKLTLSHFELKTKHPFTISRGTTVVQPTLVVTLEQDGIRGYGESNDYPFYGCTLENMARRWNRSAAIWNRGRSAIRPRLWDELDPKLSSNRFAQNALDQAAWDLWGKVCGAPVGSCGASRSIIARRPTIPSASIRSKRWSRSSRKCPASRSIK